MSEFNQRKESKMDNENYYTDGRGDVWRKHSFDYKFDGGTFSLNAWARSAEEAKTELLEAIRNAEYHHGPS